MKRTLAALLLSVPAAAGEFAVLESGFRMRIERHEPAGSTVRLFTGKDSFVEVPVNTVVGFEAEEYVPPPPAAVPAPEVKPAVPTVPVAAKPQRTPKEMVDDAARQHGLPPEFVHLVARAESAYQQTAVSSKGAIGIMQLMPSTAAALHADPYDAEQNVEAGTRMLRDLLIEYQNHPDQVKRALAAYNAGPGAVQKYNGVPPYRETQLYVNKILEAYRKTLPANSGSK